MTFVLTYIIMSKNMDQGHNAQKTACIGGKQVAV